MSINNADDDIDTVIRWRAEAEQEDALAKRKSISRMHKIGRYFSKSFSDWTHYHLSVFLLTFFSYALFHASRKTLSNVKGTLSKSWRPQNCSTNFTFCNDQDPFYNAEVWKCGDGYDRKCLFESGKDAEKFEGVLDACFLFAYAVGLYISGILGDRVEPRLVISFGMWLSAIFVFLFGTLSEWLHFYSYSYYVVLWLISGFIQSSGWPTEVAVIGNWFGRSSRGLVLGLWSACASVGNIIGTLLSAKFLQHGYEYTFLVNASMLFAGGIVIFFGLVSAPREVGFPDPKEEEDERERSDSVIRPPAVGFLRAVLLPGVIAYSLAYACLKLVNYSLFFWLPLYLGNNFGWSESEADNLSVYYDWGGIIGGFLGGIITDHLATRTPVVIGFLVLSIFALFGYSKAPNDKLRNGVLLGVAGFFIGGPANLISAAVSADLGRQPEIRGNAEALGTVTGIIDGTGSIGAAVGQVILPAIQTAIGWQYVFYFFMIMTVGTIICLLPLLWKEFRVWRQKKAKVLTGYRRLSWPAESLWDDQSIGDGEAIFGPGPTIRNDQLS